MNFAHRQSFGARRLGLKALAFTALAGVAFPASALDSTRYYPLKAGYQWDYKNTSTGATSTSKVGSPVRLSTGVLAFPTVSTSSDFPTAQNTTYETSDQNGARTHQTVSTDTAYNDTAIYTPPFTYLPPNPVVGNTYSFSGTVTSTGTFSGTASSFSASFSWKYFVAGFETVSNYAGTQSWTALKVVGTYTSTTSGVTIPPITVTSWYVDGIGAVQSQSPNASGVPETYKLVSTNVIPFTVAVTSTITATSATLATKIEFKPAEVGKSGAVYVTAVAPQGSLPLGTTTAKSVARAGTTTQFVLYQLTSTGWQPVVNGNLIPYLSGTLGDALAAQSILNNTDPTNLKGAQFCLGYGTNAAEMAASGRMQSVATIPDPTATSTAPQSCLVGPPLSLVKGWNLVGNSLGAALDVASAFGDTTKVATVWKWNAVTGKWALFAPSLTAQGLADYAAGKGYEVLSTLYAGDGFWVNATSAMTASLPPGAPVTASTFQNMATGWNLIAVGESPTPSAFNKALSLTPPATGEIPANMATLWAWDSGQSNWYFYAPSLEKTGGLANYIASKNYLSFGTRLLDPTTGFWVNR